MEELLLKLYEKNIKVSIDNNYKLNLKINGNDNDNINDIIEEVKINKQSLIDYISSLNTKKSDTSNSYDILEDTLLQVKLQETYEATPQQKSEFLRRFFTIKYAFNIVFTVELPGSDNEIIRKVIDKLIERHEILRTTFLIKDKEIRQKVHPKISDDFEIAYINLTQVDNKDEILSEEFQDLKANVFDFENGPIIAVKIIEYDADNKGIIFAMHHLISDLVSADIIKKEISLLYNYFIKKDQQELPELKFQSKEYASWVYNYIKSSSGKNKINRYREKILNSLKEDSIIGDNYQDSYITKLEKELNIALGKKDRKDLPDFFGDIYNIYPDPGAFYQNFIEEERIKKLNKLANTYQSSIFNMLIAIFAITFYRKNKNKSVRIATLHSGRLLQEFENIIGWFASEIILCLSVKEDFSIREFLENISDTFLETSQYSFYPYEKIMHDLDLNLDTLAPIFINYQVQNERYNMEIAPLHRSSGFGYFVFGCDFIQYDNCIKMMINYNIKHFSGIEVQQLVEDCNVLIDQLFAKPEILINELFVEQSKNLL
ncbi:condensation domain-containing protein [Chryseobacterium taeanense]|nr:condensation domain-containing protein [Chryseobacterium taeanense]